MNVKIYADTLGDEIKKAILDNSKNTALSFNKKQAEKYLTYCKKTGDPILIAYAQQKLNSINSFINKTK